MKTTTLLCLLLSSCLPAQDSTVIRAAEGAGLHDVEPSGFAPFSCSKSDTFQSHFTARNSAEKPVRGTVCCGVLKDCTVRFE